MPRSNLVMGLDIGSTKTCAVIAGVEVDAQPNIPNIVGVGTVPCTCVKRGVVVDLEATTTAIYEAVIKAQRMAGEEIRNAVVGITGEHIACLNSRSVIAIPHSGAISHSDVKRVLEASRTIVLPPDREIIHAVPRWYSVDGQGGIKFPVDMYASRLEVETHVVTGVSSFIHNVVKCVEATGLFLDIAVLQSLATSESVLLPAEKDLGVCMADIGGGSTELAIYIDGEIYYSAFIPVGGEHVTKDIAIGLRCSLEEAERVKLAYGTALAEGFSDQDSFEVVSLGVDKTRRLPMRVLAEIIEPRAAEICQLIMRQVEKAGCDGRIPAGLVLTGGGSQLQRFPEVASKVTGLPVRVASPGAGDMTGLADAVSTPACSAAVGLILFWARHLAMHAVDEDNRLFFSRLFRKFWQVVSTLGGNHSHRF